MENSRRGIRRIELEFGGVVVKSDNKPALTSQTKSDEICAQYGGSEEVDGRMDMSKRLMAWHREIGLEFVDIIVKADNEPALTSLVDSWSTLRANDEWIEDDRVEQSGGQLEEQRNRGGSDSTG